MKSFKSFIKETPKHKKSGLTNAARIYLSEVLLRTILSTKRELEASGVEVDDILLAYSVNNVQARILLNMRYEQRKQEKL